MEEKKGRLWSRIPTSFKFKGTSTPGLRRVQTKLKDSKRPVFSTSSTQELKDYVPFITTTDRLVEFFRSHSSAQSSSQYSSKKRNPSWRVKLLLCSQPREQTIRERMAIRLSAGTQSNEKLDYGKVTPALMIGPFFLDWKEDSLVLPEEIADEGLVFALDLCLIADPAQDPVIVEICRIIADYNCSRYFHEQTCGHQQFVDHVLNKLRESKGSEFRDEKGYVQRFLTDLQEGCGPHVHPSKIQLRYQYKNDKLAEERIFTNHRDFDEYASQMLNSITREEWQSLKEEFFYLRAIDRTFWLRYYALTQESSTISEDQSVFKPWFDENDCQCPFQDPFATGTITNNPQSKTWMEECDEIRKRLVQLPE